MLGTLSTVTEHTEDRSAEDPTRQGLLGGVTLYMSSEISRASERADSENSFAKSVDHRKLVANLE